MGGGGGRRRRGTLFALASRRTFALVAGAAAALHFVVLAAAVALPGPSLNASAPHATEGRRRLLTLPSGYSAYSVANWQQAVRLTIHPWADTTITAVDCAASRADDGRGDCCDVAE